jgi:AraC-like DNA-binding protein
MGELLRLRSRDIEAVESTWQQFLPSASLDRADPERFRFLWTSVSMPGFSLVEYQLEAGVRSRVDPVDQLFACQVTMREGRVGTDRLDFDPAQPWLCPELPTAAAWDGNAIVRAFIFDRRYAEQMARRITGDDRLRLRVLDHAPRSSALGVHWTDTFDHMRRSMQSVSGPEHPLIDAELRRHALRTTLTVFSTSLLDAGHRPAQTRAAPTTVRRAISFIDEHATDPITVEDVATAVHISTRGLQYAFRRATGLTPMAYLRRVRLTGAHHDLRSPDGGNVAEIARRWGFPHLSRFASYYRDAYGRNPSETLAERPAPPA